MNDAPAVDDKETAGPLSPNALNARAPVGDAPYVPHPSEVDLGWNRRLVQEHHRVEFDKFTGRESVLIRGEDNKYYINLSGSTVMRKDASLGAFAPKRFTQLHHDDFTEFVTSTLPKFFAKQPFYEPSDLDSSMSQAYLRELHEHLHKLTPDDVVGIFAPRLMRLPSQYELLLNAISTPESSVKYISLKGARFEDRDEQEQKSTGQPRSDYNRDLLSLLQVYHSLLSSDHCKIEVLYFNSFSNIDVSGGLCLATAISVNQTLRVLGLPAMYNVTWPADRIRETAIPIADALTNHPTLRRLEMSGDLFRGLVECTSLSKCKVEHLYIYCRPNKPLQVPPQFAELNCMQTLCFAGCRLSKQTLLSLVSNLPGNLSVLELSINVFDEDTCVALASGLPFNTLRTLDLHLTHMNNDMLAKLEPGLAQCKAMQALNLGGNELTDNCLDSLSVILKQMVSLTNINLTTNGFDSPGLHRIGNILRRNHTLKYIDLTYNQYPPAAVAKLASHLHSNTTLEYVGVDHDQTIIRSRVIRNIILPFIRDGFEKSRTGLLETEVLQIILDYLDPREEVKTVDDFFEDSYEASMEMARVILAGNALKTGGKKEAFVSRPFNEVFSSEAAKVMEIPKKPATLEPSANPWPTFESSAATDIWQNKLPESPGTFNFDISPDVLNSSIISFSSPEKDKDEAKDEAPWADNTKPFSFGSG